MVFQPGRGQTRPWLSGVLMVVAMLCVPVSSMGDTGVCGISTLGDEANEAVCDSEAADTGVERAGCARQLGDHFYDREMYYRAVGAYEEVALFGDRPCLVAYARLSAAMAYHHGGQYRRAASAYEEVLGEFELDADLGGLVRLQRIIALADYELNSEHGGLGVGLAGRLDPLTRHEHSEYYAAAKYHLVRMYLLDGQPKQAADAFDTLAESCQRDQHNVCGRIDAMDRALSLPVPDRKSAVLAGVLSTIIPGAGSMYAHHFVDGLYYLGGTALGTAVSTGLYETGQGFGDQRVSFYVVGTLTTLYYLGNVVQAVLGVHRYNHVSESDYRRQIVEETAVELPLEGRF